MLRGSRFRQVSLPVDEGEARRHRACPSQARLECAGGDRRLRRNATLDLCRALGRGHGEKWDWGVFPRAGASAFGVLQNGQRIENISFNGLSGTQHEKGEQAPQEVVKPNCKRARRTR